MADKVTYYLDRDLFSSTFLKTFLKDQYGNEALQASEIACANGEVVSLNVKSHGIPYLNPHEQLQLRIDEAQQSGILDSVKLALVGKITEEFTESPLETSCRNAAQARSRYQSR